MTKKIHKNETRCNHCGWIIKDGLCLGCEHVKAEIEEQIENENTLDNVKNMLYN